jgi:poly(A) polymerase
MNKVRDVKERDKLREFQSPVGGEEIMQIFNIPPSRKVGEIKTAIEEAILDGEIGNNYEEAFAFLMKIKDRFI